MWIDSSEDFLSLFSRYNLRQPIIVYRLIDEAIIGIFPLSVLILKLKL